MVLEHIYNNSVSQETARSMGERYGYVFFCKYPIPLLAEFGGLGLCVRDLVANHLRYARRRKGMQG